MICHSVLVVRLLREPLLPRGNSSAVNSLSLQGRGSVRNDGGNVASSTTEPAVEEVKPNL